MNVATLIHMGYVLDRDFVAFADRVDWKIDKPPTPEEIRAAEPAALLAQQAEEAKRIESTTARDDAKQAIAALDTIIAGAPTATNAQMRTWLEQLARISKHHIIATVGR